MAAAENCIVTPRRSNPNPRLQSPSSSTPSPEARFSPSPPRPHEGVDISSDQRGATSLLRSKRGNAREGGHSNLMLQYDGRRGDIETSRTQLLRCERTANSGLDEPKDTSCRLLRYSGRRPSPGVPPSPYGSLQEVHRRRTKVIVYPATHVLSMNELEPISSSFPVAAYLAPYSSVVADTIRLPHVLLVFQGWRGAMQCERAPRRAGL
ncbi:hypothetical protein C8F01DRAFT_791415 [Mycena amicta]|nr:hypothetical protein C8F01DRAFT_791415 [Mycena amicta]